MDHVANAVRFAKSVLGSKRAATAITTHEEFVAVAAVKHGMSTPSLDYYPLFSLLTNSVVLSFARSSAPTWKP